MNSIILASTAITTIATTTTPPLGRLDWDISRPFHTIFGPIVLWLNNTGLLFELTVLLVFINQFLKKDSHCRSAYYILLFILCLLDAVSKFFGFIVNITLSSSDFFVYLNDVSTWYLDSITGIFHLMLALNRFSAAVFSLKYKRIWNKNFLCIIVFILFLFPFILLLHCPQYIWNVLTQNFITKVSCSAVIYDVNVMVDAVNGVCAAIFGILAAISLYKNRRISSFQNQRPEFTLLFQSLFTTFFFALSVIVRWLITRNAPDINDLPNFARMVVLSSFLSRLVQALYLFYHYAGLIILVSLSKSFRDVYFNFYFTPFRLLLKRNNNQVSPILSTPATSNNTSSNRLFHERV